MDYKELAAHEASVFIDAQGVVPKRTFTDVELFAGAGGMALGLTKAGFKNRGAIEWDKHAVATLRENKPNWNVIEGDINQIAEEGFRTYIGKDEVDLLSGGPPCQSFSYAGKRLGLEDTRGTLFYAYAKALEELRPKVFLFENVKGLRTHDGGKTFETIMSVFSDCGYQLQWKVLNANHYGVAQKRERMIVIGVREDLVAKAKEPLLFPQQHDYQPILRDVLQNVPDSHGTGYSERKRAVMELVPQGGNWKDLPVDVAKDYMKTTYYAGGGRTGIAKRLSWDKPTPTIITSPSQKQTERCHPEETRPLTVRESARIQSFPDNWTFCGGIGSQYKQIGNAVPVLLATAVGEAVIRYLNQF